MTLWAEVSKSKTGWNVEAKLPKTSCQDLLDSVPLGMKPLLTEMEMDGEISGSVKVQKLEQDVTVDVKVKNDCRVTTIPHGMANAVRGKKFKRTIYDPKGNPRETVSGVGSTGWTSIANVSPYVVLAVITMEDPSFRSNDGFDVCAIENSIRDNIKEGKFKRGASTISMQLAKNIWLGREKTVSRKVQEAFLTIMLEQKLRKDQIMELYLNSVEFGPNTYGVGAAAKRYFNKSPQTLTLAESVFLASILPKPNGAYFNADGSLHKSRRGYINLVIDLMLRKGMVTDEEARLGKSEDVSMGNKNTVDVDMTDWDVQP